MRFVPIERFSEGPAREGRNASRHCLVASWVLSGLSEPPTGVGKRKRAGKERCTSPAREGRDLLNPKKISFALCMCLSCQHAGKHGFSLSLNAIFSASPLRYVLMKTHTPPTCVFLKRVSQTSFDCILKH